MGAALQSHRLLSLPVVRATAEANVSIPFQQSAAKSSAEGDPLFSRLRIRFPADPPASSAATAPAAARLRCRRYRSPKKVDRKEVCVVL